MTRIRLLAAPVGLALALGPVADAGAQSLRGSPASVDRMYDQARDHDLTFFRTSSGVRAAATRGELVRMSGNDNYRLHQVTYPYTLETTRTFVQRLSSQYHDACGERLVVTSSVRPTSYRLFNSADKSVHPTGMAVDIRKPTRRSCLSWLRQTLAYLEGEGAIEATEEFRPPHFHVAVFPRQYLAYLGKKPGTRPEVTEKKAPQGRVANRGSSRARSGSGAPRVTYRVRRGDTLWAIARRHGTSVERLKAANGLDTSRVNVGQRIVIPAR